MNLNPERDDSESVLFVTVRLREGVVPPAEAPWIEPGRIYDAYVVLVADQEAFVRVLGPNGAVCVMSSHAVRRIADDWPEH